MIRRLFWVALGAGGAIVAFRLLSKTAAAYTPEGLSQQAGRIADSIRAFGDDVRTGMALREDELRAGLLPDDESAR